MALRLNSLAKLDPLGLTPTEGQGGLPKFDVVQADIVQGLEDKPNLWVVLEEVQGFLNIHIQHLRDIFVFVGYC